MAAPNLPRRPRDGRGLITWAVPATRNDFGVEIQRSPESTSTGNPSTSTGDHVIVGDLQAGVKGFTDAVGLNNDLWFYRWRYNRIGYDAGGWSTWACAKPELIADEPRPNEAYVMEGRRRTDTIYDTDRILKSGVKLQSSVGSRPLTRGYLKGEAADGDTVTFAQAFDDVPSVSIRGGVSYEPNSTAWDPSTAFDANARQYDVFQALNLTSTGFTVRAKLRQKGAQTSTGADFSTGNSLTSTGQTVAAAASTSVANNEYTWHSDLTIKVDATNNIADVTVEVSYVAESNGGSWDGRGTITKSCQATAGSTSACTFTDQTVQASITGLSTAGDNVRWRLKTIDIQSAGPISSTEADVDLHGYTSTDSTRGVSYNIATDAFASKTPDGDDTIVWEARDEA